MVVDNSPVLGGAELYPIEIAERLDRNEFRFIFALTHQSRVEYLSRRNIETLLYTSGKLKTFNPFAVVTHFTASVRQLVGITKKSGVDIMQANNVRAHILCAAVSIITGKPVLWVHHAYDFPLFLMALLSFIPRKIICVSKTVRAHYAGAVADKSKLEIIYNGIDFNKLSRTSPGKYLDNFGAPQTVGIKVGIIGRIESRKGQEYLITSIPRVLEQIKDAVFYVIGDTGPGERKYEKHLKELITTLGIVERVVFIGFVDRPYDAIAALDIVTQVSIKPESFGRVLIEAMALGKPVIATNIGAFCEIIEDGKDGMLVPLNDPARLAETIIKIARDPELARTLGSNGRKKMLERYDISASIEAYRILYRKISVNVARK